MTPQEEKEFAKLQAVYEANVPNWKGKEMSKMSTNELQKAKLDAQKRIFYFFNKIKTFDMLVEQLETEAESRGALLEDLQKEFIIRSKQKPRKQ